MAKAFSKTVSDGKVMASGIRANANVLSKRGLDEAYAKGLDAQADRVLELNNEQELLKGKLKEKTAELTVLVGELEKNTVNAAKIIKVDMPKEAWKEFGITAKR
ncbi:MAG: hypothetical protein LBS42_08510 [Tannerella sp.]|jgi:hypothetical protein|nr:hypothetical protein [Tannerella sp.]